MEAKGGITNASFKVLGDTVSSQIDIHIPFGGVYPALAKREHIKNLPIVLEKTLKKARLENKKKPVDVISVTMGPGLEPALWTGIVFAKELGKKWDVPVIPVNHMEGHILSVFGKNKGQFKITTKKNPILSLLVSGGHTELVLVKKWADYKIIGQTLDDAVGEAFDKVARMLGLPYPGGPQISNLAQEARAFSERSIAQVDEPSIAKNQQIFMRAESAKGSSASFSLSLSLPRPMLYSKNFDFSYSGLKTAVLYLIKDLGGLEKISEKTKAQIALEFENAAIECLIKKTGKAIDAYKIKTLIVGGGVSANKYLRSEMKKLAKEKKVELLFPAKELSTDNSIMIGIAGYLKYLKIKNKIPKVESIKATGNLRL